MSGRPFEGLTVTQDQEVELGAFAEGIGEGVWVADSGDGTVLYANPAFRRLFHLPDPERIADVLERIHPDDRDDVRASIRRRHDDGGPVEIEYRIVVPDGTARWIHEQGLSVAADDGRTRRVVTLARDITVRKRIERDRALLAETARFLSTSLDRGQILDGLGRLVVPRLADWCRIHLLNPDGGLEAVVPTRADTRWAALVERLDREHPPSPGVKGGIHDVVRTGRSTLLPDTDPEAVVGPSGSEEEEAIVRELGLVSVMIVPLHSRDRILGAMTLVSSDATRRYGPDELALAEELAARAALALDHAILLDAERMARRQVEEALEEAEEASRAKSDFLAVMSHELRTPLNAIVGYGELLETEVSGPLNSGQRKHLARIRASAWHLLELIEKILNLSKIESGTVEFAWEAVAAGELAREAADLVRPEARGKRLEVRVEGPEEPVTVATDRARLRQILLNLLTNAVKFTGEGVVLLSYEAAEDEVRFHVRDTGPGIPRDEQEAIFQAFARTGREGGRKEGTGLGLAVSRRFARLMGGDVTVESAPGEGSVFTVHLPARPPRSDQAG